MSPSEFKQLFTAFCMRYSANDKDAIWQKQSEKLKGFLYDRIMSNDGENISDEDCDEIIKMLDRNGKGNTKNSEAIAKAMVPQGAWRRMFNEFHANKKLARLVLSILETSDIDKKGTLIDELYQVNKGQKNNLTGPSGNTICAFLAAFDPVNNLSIISLKDRLTLINFLGCDIPFVWDDVSVGTKISRSNGLIIEALRAMGASGTARTLSCFCYGFEFQHAWKGGNIVKRADKTISVSVPEAADAEQEEANLLIEDEVDSIRESMQIQAMIAKIGASMGFRIWLPRADRGRVLKVWTPADGELVEDLPLGYDSTTMKTIEQIDVLWLRKRSIARAFEVEHTTSVYSGLLRMADLVALQPDIDIKLHIVAPDTKREKVRQEITRPVFSLLERRALAEICTYLSYESIKEISGLRHLAHLSDAVLEDYEEFAED